MAKRTSLIYLKSARLIKNEESSSLDIFRTYNDSRQETKNYCCGCCHCYSKACNCCKPCCNEGTNCHNFIQIFAMDLILLTLGSILWLCTQVTNLGSKTASQEIPLQVLKFLPSQIFVILWIFISSLVYFNASLLSNLESKGRRI